MQVPAWQLRLLPLSVVGSVAGIGLSVLVYALDRLIERVYQYTKHLGTVHTSALLAVAEAGSGAFLVQHLGSEGRFVPVVRRLEAKFRKPAHGRVCARCSVEPQVAAQWSAELAARGRVLAPVPIEVVDADGVIVLSSVVEWFIAQAGANAAQSAAGRPGE